MLYAARFFAKNNQSPNIFLNASSMHASTYAKHAPNSANTYHMVPTGQGGELPLVREGVERAGLWLIRGFRALSWTWGILGSFSAGWLRGWPQGKQSRQ